MVKQKHHTARNQTFKAHRNGIKKARKGLKMSMKGMDPKFLRNLRFAKKYNKKAPKEVELDGVYKLGRRNSEGSSPVAGATPEEIEKYERKQELYGDQDVQAVMAEATSSSKSRAKLKPTGEEE
mmetsp:Transcript_12337/g.45684  ORF Transcript_12337/g.45684 Transcript_12337/m.45684 type:complete len:124 (-) Transcript_12337:110-481(-)